MFTRRLPEAHCRRQRHVVHVESARTLGYWNRVQLDFSRPGKPVDKAFIEVFGTFRRECLASHWFLRLDDLQRTLQTLQDDYNNQRPLSGLATSRGRNFVPAAAVPWAVARSNFTGPVD